MTDRRYVNPRTGEVVEDVDPRAFHEFLRELGEGTTNSELSEGLWDLLQRVQDTGKAGSLSLALHVSFDGYGRIQVKDEVRLKLPEYNRPTTSFFIGRDGNATRRDPNQPELPSLDQARAKKEAGNE